MPVTGTSNAFCHPFSWLSKSNLRIIPPNSPRFQATNNSALNNRCCTPHFSGMHCSLSSGSSGRENWSQRCPSIRWKRVCSVKMATPFVEGMTKGLKTLCIAGGIEVWFHLPFCFSMSSHAPPVLPRARGAPVQPPRLTILSTPGDDDFSGSGSFGSEGVELAAALRRD